MLVLLFGITLAVIAIGLFLYARWNYGVLESSGITVVKPLNPIMGNTYNFHTTVTHLEDVKRFKKYGPVFGVYEGREAQVHVCDAELLKCIMVKDYDHFSERRYIDFGSPLLNEFPDFQPHNKWKILRQLLTPTFTLAKIKGMSSTMIECMTEHGDNLKAEISKSKSGTLEKYNMEHSIFTMLMDMIMRSLFNIRIQDDDSTKYFVKVIKHIMEGDGGSENSSPNFLKSLSFAFPFLNRYIPPMFGAQAGEDFVRTFKEILEGRRKSGMKHNDFVDQVLDWMDRLETPEFKENGITELSIMCQGLFFFIAAQDQISIILAHTILSTGKDEEVTTAIYKEMDSFLEKNGKITHENVSELVYLQACVNESLRLSPYFIRAERICTKDWEKDGVRIKKGVTVIFPLWACNRNPEYFPDPEKYDPERFMPENKNKLHPYALSTFGFGPKSCVAMKFASEVLILAAAHLFKNFRFKTRPDSEMVFYPGFQMLATHAPAYFDVSIK